MHQENVFEENVFSPRNEEALPEIPKTQVKFSLDIEDASGAV